MENMAKEKEYLFKKSGVINEDNGSSAQSHDQDGRETRSTYVIYRLLEICASDMDR